MRKRNKNKNKNKNKLDKSVKAYQPHILVSHDYNKIPYLDGKISLMNSNTSTYLSLLYPDYSISSNCSTFPSPPPSAPPFSVPPIPTVQPPLHTHPICFTPPPTICSSNPHPHFSLHTHQTSPSPSTHINCSTSPFTHLVFRLTKLDAYIPIYVFPNSHSSFYIPGIPYVIP